MSVPTELWSSNKLTDIVSGDGWRHIPTPTAPAGVSDLAMTAQDDLYVLTGTIF